MGRALFALFLTGCYGQNKFVPDKTTAFCQVALSCTDPAVLAFDGMTEASCQGTWGPVFQAEGDGCKYRRSAAKQCVSEIELQANTCPDGETSASIPEICEAVWHTCVEVPPVDPDEDTDPPTPGETGQ